MDEKEVKWYLRPLAVIIAIFFIGPFALPLVWKSPAFSKIAKILITVILIVITVWFTKLCIDLYKILLNEIKELESVL